MKKIFFILFLSFFFLHAAARHVAGGELFYVWLSGDGTSNTYQVTLRLFRDCASNGPLLENEQVNVGFYDNGSLKHSLFLPIQGGVTTLSANTGAIPCLIGAVNVCYQMATYSASITLPINTNGYTLSRTGCCRIDNISNVIGNSIGSNYITQIPGTANLPNGHSSSPQFLIKDTALVCARNRFNLSFEATDADGDSLSYTFCDAYSASSGSNNQPPSSSLNLNVLPYGNGYTGTNPLGSSAIISPTNGIISGLAPAPGQYVISVCITEWRNGRAFNTHHKDFILKVQSCDLISAALPDKIVNCKDYTVHFENLSTSSAITSYLWEFGDPANTTSNLPMIDFVYADTGTFTAKLTVKGPGGCTGYDSTKVIVYPGFTPAFTVSGSCFQNPYLFKDATTTKYGVVNNWFWDFGDVSTNADTSILQNPSYKYASFSSVTASLIVGTNKGCLDTLQKNVTILDKPIIDLAFRDTLICSIDSLPLQVNSIGTYLWTPNKNIINPTSATPIVYPKDTTTYYITVNNNGCINTDSVKVNVLDFITVDAGLDTSVCKTDTFRLHPVSYALGYQWSPSTGLNNATIKYPLAQPPTSIMYHVLANLGKCQAQDSVFIKVTPYPQAFAGVDTVICFGSRVQLNGIIKGSSFNWQPANTLLNANTLNPIAGPSKTTNYILNVFDTLGCPKPFADAVLVKVVQPININAGNDTSVVVNQPLVLQPRINNPDLYTYVWSPSSFLNNPNTFNATATLDGSVDSITYKIRAYSGEGCFGEDAVKVKVFKTGPDIFVPSAFTPNNDGLNDILKPITVGISKLNYFNIYNRWGQLIYTTTEIGKGWDGTINATAQPSGTYVFTAEGTDYKGNIIFRKGTTVLIR